MTGNFHLFDAINAPSYELILVRDLMKGIGIKISNGAQPLSWKYLQEIILVMRYWNNKIVDDYHWHRDVRYQEESHTQAKILKAKCIIVPENSKDLDIISRFKTTYLVLCYNNEHPNYQKLE